NLIVIVNDNEMSIAENHGGLYASLARLRESGGREGPNPFRALGMDYRYLEQGNDVNELVHALGKVRDVDHPLVLHIHTIKGLGLDEEDAEAGVLPGRHESNHWQNPLSAAGDPPKARRIYGGMAMETLERRFPDEPGLVVISPATPGSNGITPEFRARAGRHYVDTGIAEDHAAAFAAGLARAGATPVLATSSTFFQRAYDEIHEELALNALPVTLLVFAAGFSSTDHTHSGIFDIPMLASIPGLTYLAPTSGEDLLDMLGWSTRSREHGPVAIRIPGDDVLAADRDRARRSGTVALADAWTADPSAAPPSSEGLLIPGVHRHDPMQPDPFLRYRINRLGQDVALIGLGSMHPLAERCADALGHATDGRIQATVVDPRQCSLLDGETLAGLGANHRLIVTMEDGQRDGGWGQRIAAYFASRTTDPESGSMDASATAGVEPDTADDPAHPENPHRARSSAPRVICLGADAEYSDRVPMDVLRARYGLTVESLVPRILRILSGSVTR
ncbi:1-deoxy-D-xylulose-5-phosphate synthase, partial [uncultured Bifidobacterium sp.]|uniref:1-deoxy-D-xylulose-5-phosphate synthase n=1 Tax=uncultured Bifidobacterium sp. TaxID=165187 RepID=UPI0028DD35FD